jgi:VWFA-related protein
MRYKLIISVTVMTLTVGLTFSTHRSSAQSGNQEKPGLKRFGESLNQDFQKRKADEIKRAQNNASKEVEVLRLKTTLVTLDALVLDKQGRVVSGLKQEDFVITEDNRPQQISTFSLGNDTAIPRAIVLIIDYSGSQLPYIDTSVAAAKTLVDQLNPKDKMAVVTDDVELLTDFTNDRQVLKKALDSLREKAVSGKIGFSMQFSALMATLNELFDEEDLRPIIIFQTDGDEFYRIQQQPPPPQIPPNSRPSGKEMTERMKQMQFLNRRFTLDDVFAQAEKSRATIYTVIPGERLIGLSEGEQIEQMKKHFRARMKALPSSRYSNMPEPPKEILAIQAQRLAAAQSAIGGVAKLTGGWFEFLETPSQAADIYSRMLSDINLRYLIGFYPSNEARDGKRRKLNIEVRNHPEYRVLSRRSYYAPGSQE